MICIISVIIFCWPAFCHVLIDWLTNHRGIDDYNDMPTEHVSSLEYLTYFIVLQCVLAAFCQLLLNIVLYCIHVQRQTATSPIQYEKCGTMWQHFDKFGYAMNEIRKHDRIEWVFVLGESVGEPESFYFYLLLYMKPTHKITVYTMDIKRHNVCCWLMLIGNCKDKPLTQRRSM